MTTFAELLIKPGIMRQGNEDALINDEGKAYTDAQLKALNYDTSIEKMKLDIRTILNLIDDDTDNDTLDDIADKYEDRLERALMYLQLHYFYFYNQEGEDSKSYDRMKYYESAYEAEKSYFSNFKIDGTAIDTGIIVNTVRA